MFVSTSVALSIVCFASSSLAVPNPIKREVPQEHSHEQFITTVRTNLNLNNPNKIQDPIFGLLGNAAASAGQGLITDTDCLQQATADQAFTNAKAASDVNGQVAALIYRALERNTGSVGLASVLCTSIKAVNPEIAALTQHQDAASNGAAAFNKALTLTLAKQIASVGGDATLALKAGTFAPGSKTDNTGKGNTCDDANDLVGCIFTQNLLVEDATVDEVNAAVAGISSSAASKSTVEETASSNCSGTATVTVDAPVATAAPATATAAPAAATNAVPAAAGGTALNFGKCQNPTVIFGAGLDGRKATEFSFLPANLQQFNHGSALNPNIIYQFMCDNLVNQCGLTNSDQTVITCRSVQATAAALGKIGASADSFNKGLGFITDFAKLDSQVTSTAA